MMTSFHLRACPRCGGAMYQSEDRYGKYLRRLTCGYHLVSGGPPPPHPGEAVTPTTGREATS